MATIQYRLSNAQRRELTTRGRELLIALPVPPDLDEDRADLLQWARGSLLDIYPAWVRRAEPKEITVEPYVGARTAADPIGLSHVLGNIAEKDRPNVWLMQVPCVLVTLRVDVARGTIDRAKWPHAVYVDGRNPMTGERL